MTKFDPGSMAYFGPFTLSFQERSLKREGEIVPLGARATDILMNLVLRAGEVVSQRELIDLVWRNVVVEDANLRAQLTTVRKALGESRGGSQYILNVPGQGYSFVAPVTNVKTPEVRRGVPASIENLVGRCETVAALSDLIATNRFVSVVGAGGIGKTTVALAVVNPPLFGRDGEKVYFVDLSTVAGSADVLPAIATMLECPTQDSSPDRAIVSFLAAKKALLVLDNCEHVVGTISEIAGRIFRSCPEVRLLATSREPLRAEGETIYILSPLELPPLEVASAVEAMQYPAVQLFMARAKASGHEAVLMDDDVVVVSSICRQLDGIALAIELAASRVGRFGIAGTAWLLADGAELRDQSGQSAHHRHETLQAMLDWSVKLLSIQERELLQRLSVFAGPFLLDAALELGFSEEGGSTHVGFLLNSLVEKSLVFVTPIDDRVYYRLLDTTRAHAAAGLAQAGRTAEFLGQHAAYVARYLNRIAGSETAVDPRATAAFTPHLGDLRKALAWCFGEGDLETGIALVDRSAPLMMHLSQFGECQRWCSRALCVLPDDLVGTEVELGLREPLARSAMYSLGNVDETRSLIVSALALAEKLGDDRRQLGLLTDLNVFYTRRGNSAAALEAANRIAALARKSGVIESEIAAELMLGVSSHQAGDQAAALFHCRHGFQLAHDAAPVKLDLLSEARGRFMLARALWLVGFPDQALKVARQTISDISKYSHHVSYCVALAYTIPVFSWCGSYDESEDAIRKLLSQAERYSLSDFLVLGRALEGQLLVETGANVEGVEILRDALRVLRSNSYNIISSSIGCSLGKGMSKLGRFEDAIDTIEDTIARAHAIGEIVFLPDLYRTHAEVLLGKPKPEPARAENLLLASIGEARRQSARSWELRAAIPLARLWQVTRGAEDAKAMLQSLYLEFDEGFGTMDLRMAAALLKDLERERGAK